MSVSRCLLPFITLYAKDVQAARQAWKALPETCPHKDCSPGATCKGVCGEWAKAQPQQTATA